MLIGAGQDVPTRVEAQLRQDEIVLSVLPGMMESGFALTGQRLFAWRATGATAPIPLTAIGRILVDSGVGSEHLDVVVVPRQAIHPSLVLARRVTELTSTLVFVGLVAAALDQDPFTEELGPVHRFTFSRPVAPGDR